MPSDARERVAAGVYAHCQESYAAAWVNEPDECKSADLEIADAAMAAHSAWLWERADDPDVVQAVAQQIFKRPDTNIIERGEVQGYITTMLAALIGPRKEATDER